MDATRSRSALVNTRTISGVAVVMMMIACSFMLGRCSAPASAQPAQDDVVEFSADDIGAGASAQSVAEVAIADVLEHLPTTTTTTAAPVRRVAPAEAVSDSANGSRWDQLAQCESGGDWGYPPVAGGFSGGIMFHVGTWHAMGGGEYAPDAYLATREQQIVIAERTLAVSGWGAWPGCSKKFGWL